MAEEMQLGEGSEREEDLESQLDRLNQAITRTIQSAQQTLNSDSEDVEGIYAIESPIHSEPGISEDFDSDSVDIELYIEAVLLELERKQMSLEEIRSQTVEWGRQGLV